MQQRNHLLRVAGAAIVTAAGLAAAYAAYFEPKQFVSLPHVTTLWTILYGCFILLLCLTPQDGTGPNARRDAALLAGQSVSALFLVLLLPSFIVSCLLVVVVWQIALRWGLRVAAFATVAQSGIMALEKCTNDNSAMSWVVFTATLGFQIFAICAAQLVRNEMEARSNLARAHAELKAAQSLLGETAAFGERVRISRDLHDVLGHGLTVLTIQLDLAARLADGPAAENLRRIRQIAADLLGEVRLVVSRVREPSIDVRSALLALTQNTGNLEVRIGVAEGLAIVDPSMAEAVVRCVQEIITNTLRHADATTLRIDVERTTDRIAVTAADNGHGGEFDEGGGLAGMRERFGRLGGWVSIESGNHGFRVAAAIPLVGQSS